MRVQSILSSFIIVLGNPTLHLTLAILPWTIELPTQGEIDTLPASVVQAGEYECVSSADLSQALNAIINAHIVAFCVLIYMQVHVPIWSRIITFLKARKWCCYRNTHVRDLKKEDVRTLSEYVAQLKGTWK